MTIRTCLPARVLATTAVCALLAACSGNPAQLQVRTLSAQEVKVLRSGGGDEMVLAAELNGYPSPARVLEMGEELGLTPDQRFELARLNAITQGKARAMGDRIVVAEKNFDVFMAAAEQPIDLIRAHLDNIAGLHAALRGIRIASHMEAFDILTEPQRRQYAELRDLPPAPTRPVEKEPPRQSPLY